MVANSSASQLVRRIRPWEPVWSIMAVGECNPHRADGTVGAGLNGQHLGIFALLEVDRRIVGVVGT